MNVSTIIVTAIVFLSTAGTASADLSIMGNVLLGQDSIPSVPPGPPAHVQSTSTVLPGAATIAVVFQSNNTAGNLIVCSGDHYNSTMSTPTDTAGNTYTFITGVTKTLTKGSIWYAKNINGGANTVTSIASANGPGFACSEYSGLSTTSPIDTWATSNGTTDPPSTSITTAQDNEMLYGGLFWDAGLLTVAANGGTLRVNYPDNDSSVGFTIEDKLATTAGSNSLALTKNANPQWGFPVVAFK